MTPRALLMIWAGEQSFSECEETDPFTPKSNGINVTRGRGGGGGGDGLGEGVSDQLKALSAVCSHFNDLEIKEDMTKADGADSVSAYVSVALPNQCIHLFTCTCQRSRAWKASNTLCSFIFFFSITELLLPQKRHFNKVWESWSQTTGCFFFFHCCYNYSNLSSEFFFWDFFFACCTNTGGTLTGPLFLWSASGAI